jgi:hypothetical protein
MTPDPPASRESNMTRSTLPLALLLALAAPSAQSATAPDPGVKAALDAQKLKYEIDKDGDFRVIFDLDEGRSQLVWIRSPVNSYGALKVREVWSAGYKTDDPLSAQQANRLLDRSHDLILGGWTREKGYAMLVVKIPANASAQQLRDAAEYAADVADNIEKEFTPGKDDL